MSAKRDLGIAMLAVLATSAAVVASGAERRLSMEDYRDKMAGAWLGQSAGVAYGAPTEFKTIGATILDEKMPTWKPEMINNTFSQDDIYVEMTFLDVLVRKGLDVTAREAGIEFANSRYRLWCANANARDNLRRGIAAPWSGHPRFHPTPYDIDYQIEADYSGIIAPGMPNRAIALGNTFGAIMNYGDGLYAGQFIGAMYSEAFFADDRVAVVEAALKSIPEESEYAAMVRQVLADYRANPRDWTTAWKKVTGEYYYGRKGARYVSCPEIDVRLNGAYVVIGYLFGEGDFSRTVDIATRCGCDSDCNPSSACGVLGVQLGAKGIPPEYTSGLDKKAKWEFTDYDWDALVAACEGLVRKVVVAEGGRVERDSAGREWLVIPVSDPRPNKFEPADRPGPLPADVRLTDAEMARIGYLPCGWQGAQSEPRKR